LQAGQCAAGRDDDSPVGTAAIDRQFAGGGANPVADLVKKQAFPVVRLPPACLADCRVDDGAGAALPQGWGSGLGEAGLQEVVEAGGGAEQRRKQIECAGYGSLGGLRGLGIGFGDVLVEQGERSFAAGYAVEQLAGCAVG
jgi:hypothetical protein